MTRNELLGAAVFVLVAAVAIIAGLSGWVAAGVAAFVAVLVRGALAARSKS